MNYEIEKKYVINSYKDVIKELKKRIGHYHLVYKSGFWWTGDITGYENVVDFTSPIIQKEDVAFLKDIGDFIMPEESFHFVRLRINNNKDFIVTFKTKEIVNETEHNKEYEFNLDYETFKRILNYLTDKHYIFYYNVKKSHVFDHEDFKIEVSTFNDLKDAYLEIELTGDDKEKLSEKLETLTEKLNDLPIKVETRNYSKLSRIENAATLKNKKIIQYSKEAMKELNLQIEKYEEKNSQ